MAKQRTISDGDLSVMAEKALREGYVEGITAVVNNDGEMVEVAVSPELARQARASGWVETNGYWELKG